MVMCERENSIRSSFRLSSLKGAASGVGGGGGEDTPSSASLYKQRIDAMFDDSRSVASHGTYGHNLNTNLIREASKVGSLCELKTPFYEKDENDYNQNQITNSVQDRIEKMFADMTVDSKGCLGDTIGVHTFNVDYLGSIPLQQKVTSLSGLQGPLRSLYFAYRKNLRHKTALTGQLEISKSGLKVRYQGDKGDLEQLNPFPTIAVWSAVKFVVQAAEKENNILHYAFLPLITDPDNIDKKSLFKVLEQSEKKYILGQNDNAHSPLFAVVMRKIGVAKQLECHGFVCQTSEDAIVIAATLYKSLMAHMSLQGHLDPVKSKRKLKNRNGITGMSIASSKALPPEAPVRPPRKKRSSTSSASEDSDKLKNKIPASNVRHKPKRTSSVPEAPPLPPLPTNNKLSGVEQVKAKLESIKNINDIAAAKEQSSNVIYKESIDFLNSQHKKSNTNNSSSSKSTVSEKIEMFKELEKKKPPQRPKNQPPPIPTKTFDLPGEVKGVQLGRKQSLRKSNSDAGDILTKVAIPRSGSFLNAGGLTRYKSIGHRNNGKKGGGSPLGFHELFHEFRVQENLHNMDDILGAIIDSDGMSFNDLKPIYKEFLLKLAVTLTKDEIFQHSKAIMKRQRKKTSKKTGTMIANKKRIFFGRRLKLPFRKPFVKENLMSKLLGGDKHKCRPEYKFERPIINKASIVVTSESSVSTSSYDLHQFRPKEPCLPPPKRQSIRKRNSKRDSAVNPVQKQGKYPKHAERTSTSEDSDFLTLSGRLGCQNRNSSSGYVSCSECDSESCTDRCYCSMKNDYKSKLFISSERKKEKLTTFKSKSRKLIVEKCCCGRDEDCCDCSAYDYSWCDCDTESCAESTKCYCPSGKAPTAKALPPQASQPQQARRKAQPSHGVPSTKSLEYLSNPYDGRNCYGPRVQRAFCQYERLQPKAFSAVEYKKTRMDLSYHPRSFSSDNVSIDCEFLLNGGLKKANSRRNAKKLSVCSAGAHEAISVKKSAEMAAVFADVHMSQRTDIRSAKQRLGQHNVGLFSAKRGIYTATYGHLPLARKTSLEDTLGYLP